MGRLIDETRLAQYDEEYVQPSVIGSEQLLKDTVGFTRKNLLPEYNSTTANGITFKVNQDGSITTNGTATVTPTTLGVKLDISAGKYTLNGCPKNGSDTSYKLRIIDIDNANKEIYHDYGDGVTFAIEQPKQIQVDIRFVSGYTANNLVFYPMLRKADILDDTFEPYHASIESLVSSNTNKLTNLESLVSSNTNKLTNLDSAVTNNSTKLVTSGTIYTAINNAIGAALSASY